MLNWSELRVKSVSFLSTGCMIVASQMKVLLLWLQLWDQTLNTWEILICLGIKSENQWICWLMYYRILAVNWRTCGKIIFDSQTKGLTIHNKGIVHFEINFWYVLVYLKCIQDGGVFVFTVFSILIFKVKPPKRACTLFWQRSQN